MNVNRGLVGYFGFGSLVNRHTLRTDYVASYPATLKGWRRHWQSRSHVADRDVALLSIHREETCSIMGMLVIDRLENLSRVDKREVGYNRHRLELQELEVPGDVALPEELCVYIADRPVDANDKALLLQSYMDAVMQGFRNEYGDEGVRHFVETTSGFERKIIADRGNPLYPRSVSLTPEEIELFDRELVKNGVRYS